MVVSLIVGKLYELTLDAYMSFRFVEGLSQK